METTILKWTTRTSKDGSLRNLSQIFQRTPHKSLTTPHTTTFRWTDARPWRHERQTCRPGWTAITSPTDQRWWRLSFCSCASKMQSLSMWRMTFWGDMGTNVWDYHPTMLSSIQLNWFGETSKASNMRSLIFFRSWLENCVKAYNHWKCENMKYVLFGHILTDFKKRNTWITALILCLEKEGRTIIVIVW